MQSYVITYVTASPFIRKLNFYRILITETRYLRLRCDVLLTGSGAVLMNHSLRIYTAPLLREYRSAAV